MSLLLRTIFESKEGVDLVKCVSRTQHDCTAYVGGQFVCEICSGRSNVLVCVPGARVGCPFVTQQTFEEGKTPFKTVILSRSTELSIAVNL